MINDKGAIIQVIGSLMKNPLLLANPKYSLNPNDFRVKTEKYIFSAIYNLFASGVEKISEVDVDTYLQNHEGIYQNFTQNNGIEYLQDCLEISEENNFDYYYTRMKKCNLLNDLQGYGFEIKDIYPDMLDSRYAEKMDKFERMSLQDIFDNFRRKISNIETEYQCGDSIKTIKANEGIKGLLQRLKTSPDIGAPLEGNFYNTAVRGARLGMYYIRSAGTGVGKSRSMAGDAARLAYPFRYDTNTQKWVFSGSCERVLYVGTEQDPEEIQTLILAYLTGINEEKILYGTYTFDEQRVINEAERIMSYFEDNLIIAQIPDPNIKSVQALIRQQVLQNDISYVFYDYIFSSPSLMTEFKGANLREDVVLMMMSTALKDLAVELNVFLQTATQVTVNENERKGPKTQNSLRSAKSIADKADVGCIISRLSAEDNAIMEAISQQIGIIPNQVTDIYKLRRGRYNNVRIWSYFDGGTCRRRDLFITDGNMNEISDFVPFDVIIDYDDKNSLEQLLDDINNNKVMVVSQETGEVLEEIPLETEERSMFEF